MLALIVLQNSHPCPPTLNPRSVLHLFVTPKVFFNLEELPAVSWVFIRFIRGVIRVLLGALPIVWSAN